MDTSFDIFLVVKEDDIHWIDSVTSLAQAKVRVAELGVLVAGKYLILAKPSGERTIIVSPLENNGAAK